MTGQFRFKNFADCSLMNSNCVLRSGFVPPSSDFRLAESWYSNSCNNRQTCRDETVNPCSFKVAPKRLVLLVVQRSGDIGSPLAVGSTRASSAGNRSG